MGFLILLPREIILGFVALATDIMGYGFLNHHEERDSLGFLRSLDHL